MITGQPMRQDESRDKNILVFGAGRSGTTWLAQTIAAAGLELVFEPMNSQMVPECRDWKPHPLLFRKGESFPWKDTFTELLEGRIRSDWTIRDNPGAERKVVKLIRANLMIEWILETYDVHPVFIIRNPLAVVASMKKEGWEISPKWINKLLSAPRLRDPFFSTLPGVVEMAGRELGAIEAKAIFWCILNTVPQQLGLFERMHMVLYEALCRDPEGIFIDLAGKTAIPVTPPVLDQLRRPSFMAGSFDAQTGYDPTSAWRNTLTPAEVKAVERIVRQFRLDEFMAS